jgi:hypothetical protein
VIRKTKEKGLKNGPHELETIRGNHNQLEKERKRNNAFPLSFW